MRREQVVVDRRSLQPGPPVGPVDEGDEVLPPGIDPRIAYDPEESHNPRAEGVELVVLGNPIGSPPGSEELDERTLFGTAELSCRDILKDGEEINLHLEREALGDADGRTVEDVEQAGRRAVPASRIRPMDAVAVLFVDQEVEELRRRRASGAPLVRRRKEDLP